MSIAQKNESGEILVRVENISKKFCRSLKRSLWYGIQDIVSELNFFPALGSSETTTNMSCKDLRKDEFWAVRDVSFELRRGECLGLIGHNGAGKTTLLKLLNGLIRPDRGSIEIRGKVGALIALNAGFNPILTGRENIYINASVLGLSKREIDSKVDEIIDFSEIEGFIDSPVQSYSSGMQVRLGYAIASSLKPDVLILDEVLAVGDISFVVKCLNRIRQLSKDTAIILVSHNMQSISAFASRIIFMEHGRASLDTTNPSEAIDKYYQMVPAQQNVAGTGEATLDNLEFPSSVNHGEVVFASIRFSVGVSFGNATVHLYIMDESLTPIVCMPLVDDCGDLAEFNNGWHSLRIRFGAIELASGKYSLTVVIFEKDTSKILLRSQGLCAFRIATNLASYGKVIKPVFAEKIYDE
jgi:lipopolysaccharide transport system ATP-binding protein